MILITCKVEPKLWLFHWHVPCLIIGWWQCLQKKNLTKRHHNLRQNCQTVEHNNNLDLRLLGGYTCSLVSKSPFVQLPHPKENRSIPVVVFQKMGIRLLLLFVCSCDNISKEKDLRKNKSSFNEIDEIYHQKWVDWDWKLFVDNWLSHKLCILLIREPESHKSAANCWHKSPEYMIGQSNSCKES